MAPMLRIARLTTFIAAFALPASAAEWDPPKRCDSCAEWNAPREPFRVFGNTYYVGVAGLSSLLVTSDAGHILLDGGLTQSAEQIAANVRTLGFRIEDVRLIVSSHEHFDHAGGIAALQRASGARVAASAVGARALERGLPSDEDPQIGFGREACAFPRAKRVVAAADGEALRVGPLAITAHYTPGHTPGSTTWTWRSCDGERCLDVVYADSLNAVAAPGFRFTGDALHPSVEKRFRDSIARVSGLPCDVVVAVHPSFTGLDEKRERQKVAPDPNPFIDPGGCRSYAAAAGQRLERHVAEERSGR